MPRNRSHGKRKSLDYQKLLGKHYVCSNPNCTNETRIPDMADRKLMCTKCNAGFFIAKAQKQKAQPTVKVRGMGHVKRARVGDTMHVKSFGKWKQHRLSDGEHHPVKTYNMKEEASSMTKAKESGHEQDIPW